MFGFSLDEGLVVTVIGVVVAGFAAVLGIWMERDERKPPRYAYALSALILLATLVSVMQSYLDSKESDKLKEDMARLLQKMDQIAASSDNPELLELVKSELSAQSRANPDVVEKLAQRVADDGEDPATVLAKHLDQSEVEAVARKGVIKPRSTKVAKAEPEKDAAPAPEAEVQKRKEVAAKQAAAMRAAGPAGRGDPNMMRRQQMAAAAAAAQEGETPPEGADAAPAPVRAPAIALPPGAARGPQAARQQQAAAAAAEKGQAEGDAKKKGDKKKGDKKKGDKKKPDAKKRPRTK